MQVRYFFLLLFAAANAWAQPSGSEWAAFTSMRNVSRLWADDAYVWALTSGGVLRFDREARTYERFTRLDGLPGNNVSSLTVDAQGDLWFGTRFQGLSRLRVSDGVFDPPYMDFVELTINALYAYEDRVFVGTERGISAFLIDKGEVKETYRQLIRFSKDTPVNAIAVYDGHLWAGTDLGIAWADLQQPNLQDPASWQSTTVMGRTLDFLVYSDTLFCVTVKGVWTAAGGDRPWRDMFNPPDFIGLGLFEGQLVGATESGDFYKRTSRFDWNIISSPNISGIADLSDIEGPLWIATQTGLRVMGDERMPPTRDPAYNAFYDLALSEEGHLWAASVPKDGFPAFGAYQYDGEAWTVHNLKSGLSSENTTAIHADANGLLWIGNWGRGVDVLDASGQWRRLNSGNSAIEGIGGGSFAPISDVERDADGNMWIANVQSGLVVMDGYPPQRQLLNRQEDFGLPPGRDIGKISIAADGLIWISTARDGFMLFDDGGTPFTSGDEFGILFNSLTYSELSSDRASAILADASGRVWVGTDNGLNAVRGTYDGSARAFDVESWRVYNNANSALPSNVITVLEEGANGAIWVGTEEGIAQIDARGEVAFVLNTSNSGLISNRVNSLLFDEEREMLWIGTLDGLSRLQVQLTDGRAEDAAQIYPNPLVLNSRGGQLSLSGLPLGAAVSIYTASGQLVRRIEAEPGVGSVTWNGLNEANFLVGSGVYYFVASDGNAHLLGKFAVVNDR